MKRSTKMRVPFDKVRELAELYDWHYAGNIVAGFELMASSGFWQTKSRGITARFVYRRGRKTDPEGRITHTTVITGIPPR